MPKTVTLSSIKAGITSPPPTILTSPPSPNATSSMASLSPRTSTPTALQMLARTREINPPNLKTCCLRSKMNTTFIPTYICALLPHAVPRNRQLCARYLLMAPRNIFRSRRAISEHRSHLPAG